MKSPRLLFYAAIYLVASSTLRAQVQYAGDVLDEVTEVTQSETPRVRSSVQVAELPTDLNFETEDSLKYGNRNKLETAQAQQGPSAAISESTGFPGTEANVALLGQVGTATNLNDTLTTTISALGKIAEANRAPLTSRQIKANKKVAKANAKAAADQAKIDAAKSAVLVPKNSVYNTAKFSLYGQLGAVDQKLGGLNFILADKNYPAAGSYAYRAELGTRYSLSEQNTLDMGLRYSLMNGLEKTQRLDHPSVGQSTESQSTMWLVGLQSGIDHNLLNGTDWNFAVGLGLGAEFGGLHLTERVEEIVATLPTDPSIPAPDEVAVVHYNVINVSVTPRLTLRSPELENGWQFQARVGYQFGKNTLFQADEFTSVRDELVYNPTGITATVGFVAPLPKIFRK
ncbi:MAG: hypothetical protein AB8F78_09745 [Saprospiraceae bacterium]